MNELNPIPAKPLRRHIWERRQGAVLISGLALVLLCLALFVTGRWYQDRLLRETRAQVEADISVRGIALTAVMNRRFALLDGLSAFVQTDHASPDFDRRIETYAARISASRLGIRNIAIAPDGVVRFVYPLEGNEAVLGYIPGMDIREEVRQDVAQAIDTREIILTGPVELLQGGEGLIARKAIYLDDGTYWGMVNIVLDTEMIINRAGLQPHQIGNLEIALYVSDGGFISGSQEIKGHDPIRQTILLPGEEWVLAGAPLEGWGAAIRTEILLFQGLGLAIVALLVSLIYLSLNRQAYLARAVQQRTAEISSMYAQLQEDLAKRELTERALSEQKEQYRSVFETVQDGLFIHDLDGRLVAFNQAAHLMFGYSAEEFAQLELAEYIRLDDAERFAAYLAAVREGKQYRCQAVAIKQDGTQLDCEVLGKPFTYQGMPHALSVVRDITEELQAYQLLEQRVTERTRDLMTLMQISQNLVSTLEVEPLLDMILDQLQAIVEYSGAAVFTLEAGFLRALAYRGPRPKEEVMRASFQLDKSLIDQEIVRNLQPLIIQDVLAEDPLAEEMRQNLKRMSGSSESTFRSWMGVPLIYKGDYIGNLTFDHPQPDYFRQHHAQLAQAFANQAAIAIENARLYEQVAVLASLEERQRLARELHDSVSQALYGIALGVRTSKSLLETLPLEDTTRTALDEPLNYTSMLVEAGLAEMRALIFELRPESLENEGLIPALTKQAAAIKARYQLEVVTCLGAEPLVDLDAKHALYRIAQEALHNTVKHAGATKVFLCLNNKDNTLTLTVEDDGEGFDPDSDFPGHLGLRSMRERVERLGGGLLIESTAGRGTKVTARLPLQGAHTEADWGDIPVRVG